jgi:hypothetical protein
MRAPCSQRLTGKSGWSEGKFDCGAPSCIMRAPCSRARVVNGSADLELLGAGSGWADDGCKLQGRAVSTEGPS